MKRDARLLSLGGAVALLLSWPAEAYVPSTTTKSGRPLRWLYSDCVRIRVNSKGSDDIKDGSAVTAAKKSMENWRSATKGCSYLRFEVLPDSATAAPVFDRTGTNESVIAWIETNWTHEPMAAALTTVFFIDSPDDPSDGQILDGDIEMNGVRFHYATTGASDRTDVENTITHELGHLLGLDHPCDDGARAKGLPVPKDNDGNTIPSCVPEAKLSQAIKDSTMYNFADPGETKKRSIDADSAKGICDTYPLAQDPGVCVPAEYRRSDDGCSFGGARPGRAAFSGGLLLALSVALLSWRVTRRQRAK